MPSNKNPEDESLANEPKRRRIKVCCKTNESPLNTSIRKQLEPCGIIERIILKNVFCHEHLDFDEFALGVNLLQGANGSGKSSIVGAIIVGLGGSAKATDRGTNLTSLIQSGKTWASIEIHLKNRGHMAFKPDLYPDRVIVERKLLSSGTSSYKIKNTKGQVMSTKKEDLNRILDWYNFQVDNPVLILSQERTKTFLSSTDPKLLFEFFMTATQLRQWYDTYNTTEMNLEKCVNIVKHKVESLSYLDKEVKEWEKKVQAINSLEKKKERLSNLRQAKAWADIKEDEEELHEMNLEKLKIQKDLKKLADVVKNAETNEKQLKEKRSKSDAEMVELVDKCKHWEKERLEAASILTRSKKGFRDYLNERKNLKTKLYEREREVILLQEKLEKDNMSAKAVWETTVAQLDQEKKKLKENIDMLEQGISTEQNHLQNFSTSLQEAEEEYSHYSLQEKAIKKRLENLQSDLVSLKGQKDNLTVFGQFMPSVVREMNSGNYNFQNIPIGPIGSFLKVRDQNWVHIVENVTRSILSSFLVSCSADYKLLAQIFNRVIPRHAPRPHITVTPFRHQVHQFQKYETKSDRYYSMWSIIDADNVQVANFLLDQLQVESILLVPSPDEANDLLIEQKYVPRNCKKAMTLNGDTYFPDPNFRVYSGRGRGRAQFLQVSVQDKIRDLEMNIGSTLREVEESRSETQEKKRRLDTLIREKQKSTTKQTRLHKDLSILKGQLQELKNREIPPPPDVHQLQNDLKEFEALKLQVEEKLRAVEENLEEAKSGVSEADARLKEAQTESEKIKCRVTQHDVNTNEIQTEMLRKKKQLQVCSNRKEEFLKKLAEVEKKSGGKQLQVKAKIDEILALFPERVESDKSKKELERELLALENAIHREQSNHGKLEVVTSTWRIKKQKYEQVKEEIKSQQSFVSKMKESLRGRNTLLNVAKRLLAYILKMNFKENIGARKMKGHLDIDYHAQTLKILLVKDTGNKSDQLQSVNMMSGGERSFATVSFILSLWDIVTSPIRIMDEFDVNMDVVSKNQCVEMILDSVKENIQYIMVSPLEYRQKNDNLRVFRMPDPERKNMDESEEV